MNVKKMYAYVLVFLLSLFVLTGCGSDNGGGEFKYVAPVDNGTDGNRTNGGKTTISGYVVDEAIENATIELQEINGTLIKKFENITNIDGFFSLEIDEKYKDKDFILRAYNGTISSKAFDGDLYGFHLSGEDLQINLTPLSTLLIILSGEFSDIAFSDRISKSKSLLKSTYALSDTEFNTIKDSDFSNFDIVKFRELLNSIGLNSLVQSLVVDSIDGYADESDTKLLFASAKQRVLKDAKTNFAIVDSDLTSDDVSNLTIKGISEKEDGSTGTMDMMTDVIARRTDTFQDADGNDVTKDTIVFRSFNVGKWKGKLNEETTLLARIFMDYRLTNLPALTQEEIATKLLKERSNEFKNAIKYQNMATDVPFIMPYYIELMEGLRVFALSYIPVNNTIQNEKVTFTLSKLSKSFNKFEKSYTTDENNLVQMGLLQVRAGKENLEFANYAKVNYGFRAYEIDGVKQDYDYPFFDFQANIVKSVVKGGAVGGFYDFMRTNYIFPKIQDNGNTIKYKEELLGENVTFDNISKVKLEMYKWQWGYPTLLNVADGIQLATQVSQGKESFADKIEKHFKKVDETYKKLKKVSSIINTGVELSNSILDTFESIVEVNDEENSGFLKELKSSKKIFNKDYNIVKESMLFIDNILNTKGYDDTKILDWSSLAKDEATSLLVPQENNKFNDFFKNYPKKFKKNQVIAVGNVFNALLFIKNEDSTDDDKSVKKFNDGIKNFNDTYKGTVTFKQMTFILVYLSVNKGVSNLDKNLESYISKSQIKDYKKYVAKYIAKNYKEINILNMLKSKFKDLKTMSLSAKVFSKVIGGIKDINKGDTTKVFISVGNVLIKLVDDASKDMLGNVAKSAAKAILGGGVTLALKANNISSYVAGNFLTPNKQYLELNKDGNNVSIKRPPLTLVGIDSTHISDINAYDKSSIFHDKSYNFFNQVALNNSYLVTIDKDYSVSYLPHYDVFVSAIRQYGLYDMLNKAKFLNDIFMKFDFDIEKSNNNKVDGDFQIENKLSYKDVKINVKDVQESEIIKGENDLYSFNIMKIWDKAMVLPNTQRGIFRESINVQFFQPTNVTNDEFVMPQELYEKQQSRKNYMYISTTGKEIGKGIQVDIATRDNIEYIRVENKNSFGVYMDVKYDDKDKLYDESDTVGDFYIASNTTELFPYTDHYVDDKGKHNDVELNFYDEIAQDFFENNGYSEPRLLNYIKAKNKNNILGSTIHTLVYNVKLDDITKTDNYLMLISYGNDTKKTESTLSDIGGVKIVFNMPLSSESISKIQVHDNKENRDLNSDEYTVVHTSGNKYLITIKNYKNHHEYKLIFPNTLVSENGNNFLAERELYNFTYYNQEPKANAGADQTIKKGETVTLDANGSTDDNKDSLTYKWTWKSDVDDSTLEKDDESFKVAGLSAGEHTFTLTVTDSDGEVDSDEVVVTVVDGSATGLIAYSGEEVSIPYSYDGINCKMDFGDGNILSLDSCNGTALHSFKKEWVYNVKLYSDNNQVSNTIVTITNKDNNWIGFVSSLNGYIEDNENVNDIIYDGRIYLSQSLSDKGYYWTNYRYIKPSTLNIVSGDDFTIEARIKAPLNEGGISCFDPALGVISETSKLARVVFMSPGCTYYSSIGAADWWQSGGSWNCNTEDTTCENKSLTELGKDFSDWKTIKLEVKNGIVSAYYENIKVYSMEYKGTVGNIHGVYQRFKGSGSVDWIKLYNGSGSLVYSEDFN